MVRINFQPYTSQQLVQIVNARLVSAREDSNEPVKDVIHEDGIKFAAMKVSSISGDARRVLDICRFMLCISSGYHARVNCLVDGLWNSSSRSDVRPLWMTCGASSKSCKTARQQRMSANAVYTNASCWLPCSSASNARESKRFNGGRCASYFTPALSASS